MDYYFEKEVQNRFSTLSSQQRYFVYSLCKKPDNCAPLASTADQQSTQVVHRLLLVTSSITTATTPTEQPQDEQLVSGMEVYEYTALLKNNKTKRTIYISKIDTTGSVLARGVTRRLVQAYVAAQRHFGSDCAIHVFARAQPQYIFPESAKDTSKRVLTDRQLAAWWRTTLSNKDLYSSDSNAKVTPFWIVPGEDEQEALYDIGQKQLLPGNSITWQYGYPYVGNALAKDVIPRFEDDGKGRYLGTLLESAEEDDDQQILTVDDFWTLFGFSEECGSGKVTAIFVIEMSSSTTPHDIASPTPSAATEVKLAPLEDEEYTWVWNALMTQDFHDDKSNIESTKTWLETWLDILSPRSIAITTNHNNSSNSVRGDELESISVNVESQPIQLLSVKRKSASAPGNTITDSVDTTTTDSQHMNSSTATSAVPAVNVLVPKRRKTKN